MKVERKREEEEWQRYDGKGIAEEDASLVERRVKHHLPSLPPDAVILESSGIVAHSQNPAISIIPTNNPDVVVANNSNTNNRVRLKCSTKSIVSGNVNLRGDELDDEKNNITTRLKLRESTMASIEATMNMNNKRNKNNLSKFAFLTKSESENLEDGYKWRKSYYRCTTIGCNAKKRVERCLNDPTHALTTYEGLHTHDLPPILPPPSRSFSLYNNSTLSSILGRGRGIQKGVASDAGTGARARYHANNTITSVNARTDSGSGVNNIGSLENIGTGLLEDIINLSSVAPQYHHRHQPTTL
ncbi:probable WRKY transcription factor 48 [Arachis stenosperma]|uniref:probable WRKY transcription factor 48 n=1 Tax=Arachis stenosperma TaxID=217475 RepID=UPI0025AC031D|nr:probable WRKY transcription factor 48 [Arachis stenosperma]